jgi:hypothetical protein
MVVGPRIGLVCADDRSSAMFVKPWRMSADPRPMGRRAFLAGVALSLPFTLSVALLCTTSGADDFYRPLSSLTLLALYAGAFALQVGCGVRAFRGRVRLVWPLASSSGSYMAGVFTVLLLADALVRASGVKGPALPAGVGGAFAEWVAVLASLASVPLMSALVVVVGVHAARSRCITRPPAR